jgi:hypothetical protein
MKIFDWLLGKVQAKTVRRGCGYGAPEVSPGAKMDACRKRGKDIWCPKCSQKTHVSNFGWSAYVCRSCRAVVKKCDWLMPVKEDK